MATFKTARGYRSIIMSYNVYSIKRTDEGVYTKLEIVNNDLIAFDVDRLVDLPALVDSVFGKVYISSYGTVNSSSQHSKCVTLPNWFEKLFGITFQGKLATAYKQLNKTIEKLHAKQLKMMKERDNNDPQTKIKKETI